MTTTATLRLRVRHGRITTRVFWPGATRGAQRILVALLDPSAARLLCQRAQRVVLALPPTATGNDALDVARWAGAHATELGATEGAVTLIDGADVTRLIFNRTHQGDPS
ncbi:hypothetical protein [Luteipulveratus mongoliensis]|uniref:Uncharacterized protein n=1 Tax=Luteipulveratus mongoliensis TaxID=571913 RepID=A0A0K1JGY7_9MICO|nr:hypothetical protein [Luteipulveratus mongoliensis]AKU15850.1 hypothetical protein VV02_08275 [Luteipulveratus mongoliensis]